MIFILTILKYNIRKKLHLYKSIILEMELNVCIIRQAMEKRTYDEYYAAKNEIEAFARHAVEEIENNEIDIISTYFELKDKKVKQRFFKKFYQYLDMYGSDKAKNNFELYLRTRKFGFDDNFFYDMMNKDI